MNTWRGKYAEHVTHMMPPMMPSDSRHFRNCPRPRLSVAPAAGAFDD